MRGAAVYQYFRPAANTGFGYSCEVSKIMGTKNRILDWLFALGFVCALCFGNGDALAYKVKKVCEEVATKHGPMQKCRSVLDNSEPDAKAPEKKGEEKKPSGHH